MTLISKGLTLFLLSQLFMKVPTLHNSFHLSLLKCTTGTDCIKWSNMTTTVVDMSSEAGRSVHTDCINTHSYSKWMFPHLKTFEHEAMYGMAWKVNSSLVNWCWIGLTLWQSKLAARPQLPMVCICGLAQDAYWAGLNSPLASLAPFSLLDWCLW